jgi:heterodisulfide reductase subunit B
MAEDMTDRPASDMIDFSYYPGCSMATTAKECSLSLIQACKYLGLNLIELDDWNCCGSSSAHCIDMELSFELAVRNLTLAPPHRPLVVMCPSCFRNLRQTKHHLAHSKKLQELVARRHLNPVADNLEIIHFLSVVGKMDLKKLKAKATRSLKGIKIAPYYGCMLAGPPPFKPEPGDSTCIERMVEAFGAQIVLWSNIRWCCGTFLTASKPEVARDAVNKIMESAAASGADCIVTACAMCQINLEMRCTQEKKIPILHFSEILAIAMGADENEWNTWFRYHLVDPRQIFSKLDG